MRYSVAASVALVAAVNAAPQGVTSAISPSSSAPAGCSPNYSGQFQIQVVNVTKSSAKRDIQKRANLEITLKDGKLTDSQGRTGYIAANHQFQFDGPPQTGAIYTAGWSVCQNGSLALGDDAIFYQCLSGNFYNLYDENNADQCTPIYIDVIGTGGSGAAYTQGSDGQIGGPSATLAPVSQISDGQPQASTSGQAVSQISDGQIQASTSAAAPVSQISDGQIQASTAAPVSQISDGQIQASTAAATPAMTGAPVSQISDGQIQASTSAASPVTQISDGQIQAPTGGYVPKNGTGSYTASATPAQYTGAANRVNSGAFGLLAAIGLVAAL